MEIYILAAVLVGLTILLGFITTTTVGMIRARRPLLALGPVQWRTSAGAADAAAPQTAKPDTAPAADFGHAAQVSSSSGGPSAALPPIDPAPRERVRKLRSVSALTLAESDEPLIAAGHYRRIEQQLETAFEALCEGAMELEDYVQLIDRQYAEAKRAQSKLGPLADEALHAEAAEAVAALEWCRDWARKQSA